MVRTNNRSARRDGNTINNRRGRPQHRNTNTNARVSPNHYSTRADLYRPVYAHHRPVRSHRPQGPVNGVPTGPRSTLASRITFHDSCDRATPSYGDTYRPEPQRGRHSLQDRIIDDRANGGAASGDATLNRQINHQALAEVMATTAVVNQEFEIDDFDKLVFVSWQTTVDRNNFGQASALFYGSQPTQPTDLPLPIPPILPATTFNPPLRSVRPATSHLPIRMINQPVHATSQRPVNTYRGQDPIKKLVQNKRMQRLLSDKPVLQDRKPFHQERMELRIGASKVTK